MLLAAVSTIPALIAGVSVMLGAGGGLYWAVLELVSGFCMVIWNSWILLIEVKR